MEGLLIGITAAFGLTMGSFINVAVLRTERGESLRGRSHCDTCGKMLGFAELIPIVSFVLQKGRCRSCGTALLWQYPIVEALTAFLFAGAALIYFIYEDAASPFMDLAIVAALCIALAAAITVIVTDIKYHLIPNGAVCALALTGLFFALMRAEGAGAISLFYDVVAAGSIALFFALLWLISRGAWMGFGDVKLIGATSFLIGAYRALPAMFFAFWLGSAFAGILLIVGKKSLKDIVPFGPFIILGVPLAYFFVDRFLTLTGMTILFTR